MPPIPFAPDDPACPSCGKPIKVGTPTVLKFGQMLHLRCWTLTLRGKISALERNRAARAGSRARQLRATGEADPSAQTPGGSMTDVMTDSPPHTRAFVINGEILAWDPLRRELQIGTHLVCVAPSVPVAKLTCGVTVTASGQEDRLSARWIVTGLTLA